MNTLYEKFEQAMRSLEVAIIEYRLYKQPVEAVLKMSDEQQDEYFATMVRLKDKVGQVASIADSLKNAIQEGLFTPKLFVVDLIGGSNGEL